MTTASTSASQHAKSRLSPSRIRLARERSGMSKVAVASALGTTTRSLQIYESQGAPTGRADQLADVLGVQPSFFTKPERHAIAQGQGFFRALRRASAAQLTSARATASIGDELYEWITERFKLPPVVVPDLDQQNPEDAAVTLRAVWGRGEEPVPNLVQLSEAHGVRVLSLPAGPDTVDAFSFWLNERPYVFLSMAKSAERSRFDLAHELGHLVMHTRIPIEIQGSGRQVESEADAFAAALLMPRRDLMARSGREPAVPQILRLRSYYRVSAMAMTRRLRDVGRLTDWSYRQNCVALSQRGFRSGEPEGIARERSRVFATVFPALRTQGITTSAVCSELGITPQDLHALVFGQVTVSVD
jgi:Zn-dependent peptidase ImmA (M78 family)/DNA-binding transcriptional regulator YiaG